jgi:hypothetical protein
MHAEPNHWVTRYRNGALALVLCLAFADGLFETTGIHGRFLAVLGFASAITLWCTLDARLHGKVFLRSFSWLMMWTWPVGVLAHLVWTRRAKGVLLYVLGALAVALAAGAGAMTAHMLRGH